MKYQLVKLEELSGKQTSVYSLLIDDETITLFERFIIENNNSFKSEITDIIKRLNTIAHKEGAREHFFKINEGKPGDLVCALYDKPNSNLRLYCIRYGTSLIILGGGGHKPKTIKALQENEKLTYENAILVALSKEICKRQKDKEITFTNNFCDFEGDFEFDL